MNLPGPEADFVAQKVSEFPGVHEYLGDRKVLAPWCARTAEGQAVATSGKSMADAVSAGFHSASQERRGHHSNSKGEGAWRIQEKADVPGFQSSPQPPPEKDGPAGINEHLRETAKRGKAHAGGLQVTHFVRNPLCLKKTGPRLQISRPVPSPLQVARDEDQPA